MKRTILFLLVLAVFAAGMFMYVRKVKAPSVENGTSSQATSSEAFQVEGMSRYADADFGFSFWHPDSWMVSSVNATNTTLYKGGEVQGVLNISNGTNTVTIEKVYSASSSIVDRTGVGACPVCSPMRYYFDSSAHVWMLEFPEGSSMSEKPTTQQADTTENTMGGLHMFPGSRRFHGNVIIPLSAHNFLVVTVDGSMATGFMNAQALAKTIVAADPAVATPANQAEQEKTVIEEREAYTNNPQ